jgi:hypothetical protein
LVLIPAGGGVVYGKYAGGNGSSGSPYLISTPEDLAQIGRNPSDWNKHFKLTSDVDMKDYNAADGNMSFIPIGYMQWAPYTLIPFKGVFDGNNKQIVNLCITSDGRDFVGLFGYVQGNSALIRDLTLVNPKIEAGKSMYVGAVVGKLKSGSVIRCKVKGGAISGGDCTGGLAGYNTQGMISNCDVQTDINGNTNVGGIAGYHGGRAISKSCFTGQLNGQDDVGGLVGESNGDIVYCYADGNVYADGNKVAGLVGTSRGGVNGCYAKGQVTGYKEVGGLVGRNAGQVQDCYTREIVAGNCYVGGFCGLLYGGGTISRCYAVCDAEVNDLPCWTFASWVDDGTVSASFWTWDVPSVEEIMMMQRTYTDAGWDFVGESTNGSRDLWEICEGTDYPRLWWEKPTAGDFVCPEDVDLYDFAVLFDLWLTNPMRVDITGDGIVDFEDFALLIAAWKTKPGMAMWNTKCDIWPDSGDEFIDIGDLAALASHWLGPGAGLGDIGPEDTGDGIVDFLDFAVAAKNYLKQN